MTRQAHAQYFVAQCEYRLVNPKWLQNLTAMYNRDAPSGESVNATSALLYWLASRFDSDGNTTLVSLRGIVPGVTGQHVGLSFRNRMPWSLPTMASSYIPKCACTAPFAMTDHMAYRAMCRMALHSLQPGLASCQTVYAS